MQAESKNIEMIQSLIEENKDIIDGIERNEYKSLIVADSNWKRVIDSTLSEILENNGGYSDNIPINEMFRVSQNELGNLNNDLENLECSLVQAIEDYPNYVNNMAKLNADESNKLRLIYENATKKVTDLREIIIGCELDLIDIKQNKQNKRKRQEQITEILKKEDQINLANEELKKLYGDMHIAKVYLLKSKYIINLNAIRYCEIVQATHPKKILDLKRKIAKYSNVDFTFGSVINILTKSFVCSEDYEEIAVRVKHSFRTFWKIFQSREISDDTVVNVELLNYFGVNLFDVVTNIDYIFGEECKFLHDNDTFCKNYTTKIEFVYLDREKAVKLVSDNLKNSHLCLRIGTISNDNHIFSITWFQGDKAISVQVRINMHESRPVFMWDGSNDMYYSIDAMMRRSAAKHNFVKTEAVEIAKPVVHKMEIFAAFQDANYKPADDRKEIAAQLVQQQEVSEKFSNLISSNMESANNVTITADTVQQQEVSEKKHKLVRCADLAD